MLSACHIQCIYELIVPKGNVENDWLSWKHNISLLCKFIHQYYTLTNLVPFMSMKGTSFRVAVKCREASTTYQWSILTFFVQYQTTVNWSLNDCQLTIKRLSRDYQLIWPLPYQPLYWPYTTYNKHDPVLKRQILSFFTSLIIYGCKNFSTLICWNTSRYLKWWRKLKLSAES